MFKRTKDAASAAGKKVLGYSCREGDKLIVYKGEKEVLLDIGHGGL